MGRILTKLLLVAGAAFALLPVAGSSAAPHARDFERALPPMKRTGGLATSRQAAVPGKGPVSFRSTVVDAPHPFEAVGLAHAIRPLEFRAQTTGGHWSDWVQTADGDPVFAGESDRVQVRSRGWRPHGRLHFVSVPHTRAPAALREAEKTSQPAVISRRQWGADRNHGGCHPRTAPVHGHVKAAVVHHTVTANTYHESEGRAIVLAICRYHRNANGWNDIGYNALVDRFGNIYVGRAGGLAKPIVGAHAQGFNAQTTGVASIGTYEQARMPKPAMHALARFLAWKLHLYRLNAMGHSRLVSAGGDLTPYPKGRHLRIAHITGHRKLDSTSCPGGGAFKQLPRLRDMVQARMRRSGGSGGGGGGSGGGGGGIGPGG